LEVDVKVKVEVEVKVEVKVEQGLNFQKPFIILGLYLTLALTFVFYIHCLLLLLRGNCMLQAGLVSLANVFFCFANMLLFVQSSYLQCRLQFFLLLL